MESKALLAVALWFCVETRAASVGKESVRSLVERQRSRVRAEGGDRREEDLTWRALETRPWVFFHLPMGKLRFKDSSEMTQPGFQSPPGIGWSVDTAPGAR